jgi:hypothetical protein
MTKIDELERAIESLSAADHAALRAWFEAHDARLWDEQTERDAKAGGLDKLAAEARAKMKAGIGEEFWFGRCGTMIG